MADSKSSTTIKVAVTQAEPEWLDLEKAVQKTCALIEEAASNGAKLISFPEVWITGYPAWIWLESLHFLSVFSLFYIPVVVFLTIRPVLPKRSLHSYSMEKPREKDIKPRADNPN